MVKAGIPEDLAREMMRLKLRFAFDRIRKTDEILDTRIVGEDIVCGQCKAKIKAKKIFRAFMRRMEDEKKFVKHISRGSKLEKDFKLIHWTNLVKKINDKNKYQLPSRVYDTMMPT